MNVNIKQKLAEKSAYIALALLLTLIIAFTVIAIVTAVNSQEEVPATPPEVSGDENTPPENSGDTETGGKVEDTENPEEKPEEKPEAPVYKAPCDGYVQKEFSDDTLVFSQTMNDHRTHLGIDIAGKLGDPVKAFCKGTVEKIYSDPFM